MTGKRLATVLERKRCVYVTWSAKTTAGVWMEQGAAGPFQGDAAPHEIGDRVLQALSQWTGEAVPHPSRDGWKRFQPPLWAASGVRSLRTFDRMVQAAMDGNTVTVSEWKHDLRRRDSFVPGTTSTHLVAPSAIEVGEVVQAILKGHHPGAIP